MRLIDADKLPWVDKVILVDNVDGDIVIKVAPNYTSYVNKETPTVEAITIDWIRDYMLRLSDGSEAYECILVMLEEWEKENERP